MRFIARASALLLTLTGGCIPTPDDAGGVLRITVEPRQDRPSADGHGMAGIRLEVDDATRLFRRSVEVRVSSGTLGVDDSGGQGRFTATTPADGIIELPLRYGRTPGPIWIEARTGGQVFVDDALVLEPRWADGVELSADATEIVADGAPRSTLTARLTVATPGARPSIGVTIDLGVCCADADDEPTPCPADRAPPLRVPSQLALAESRDGSAGIEVRVAAEPVDAFVGPDVEPRPPFTAFIAAAAHGELSCTRPQNTRTAVVAFRVRPR